MMSPRLIGRVALFSALVYLFSLVVAWLPNVKLSFFIIFTAGYLWGAWAGLLTGLVGMGLWTAFNPYGPAPLPIMLAQMGGAALGGVLGALTALSNWCRPAGTITYVKLAALGVICSLIFFVPVSAVDAWLFQPFWPRFGVGLVWASWSVAANAIIFPLLFRVTRQLYARESARL